MSTDTDAPVAGAIDPAVPQRTPEQEGRRTLVLEAFALDTAMCAKYGFGTAEVDIDAVDLGDITLTNLIELETAFKGDYPEAYAVTVAEHDRRTAMMEADGLTPTSPPPAVPDTAAPPPPDTASPPPPDTAAPVADMPVADAPAPSDPSLTVMPPAVVVPDGPVAVELDGEPQVTTVLPEPVTAPPAEPVTEAVTQPVTEPVTALPVIPDDAVLAALPVTDVKDLLVAHDLAANVSSHQQAISVLKAARDKLAADELALSAAVDAVEAEEAACIRTVDHNGVTVPTAA